MGKGAVSCSDLQITLVWPELFLRGGEVCRLLTQCLPSCQGFQFRSLSFPPETSASIQTPRIYPPNLLFPHFWRKSEGVRSTCCQASGLFYSSPNCQGLAEGVHLAGKPTGRGAGLASVGLGLGKPFVQPDLHLGEQSPHLSPHRFWGNMQLTEVISDAGNPVFIALGNTSWNYGFFSLIMLFWTEIWQWSHFG